MKTGENRPNREWLLRYIAGELSEDETQAADARFFSNDEFAGLVDEEYRDLLDAYAAGEMSAAEKELVERVFLGEPDQRRQLKILAAMQAAVPGKPSEPAPRGMTARLFSCWPMAISAGVLSFVIAIVLYQHNPRLRAIADRSAPVSSAVNDAPVSSEAMAPAQIPAENAFTILLLPNVSRGAEGLKLFTVPGTAEKIVFQVVLPPGQGGSEFDVRLRANDRAEARAFMGLAAKTIETQKYVEFSLPSSELPAQNYDLKIFGSGVSEPGIEQFEIRVERGSAAR